MVQKEIEYELSAQQWAAHQKLYDKKTDRLLYGGAAGGGKSFLGSIFSFSMCWNYPKIRGYFSRLEIRMIKESMVNTFMEFVDDIGYGDHVQFLDHRNKIRFSNGSEIILLDTAYRHNDPDYHRLGSTEYTFGWVEEAIESPQKACDILLSRTRYKHDLYDLWPKQLLTCNPGPGWVKEHIYEKYRDGSLPKNVFFIEATLETNPDEAFKKLYGRLLSTTLNEYDKARLLGADWDALPQTGGEFYSFFTDKNIIPYQEDIYQATEPLHISFDENVNPYLPAGIFQLRGKNLIQIDEICMKSPQNKIEHLCKTILIKYPNHTGGCFVYGDATSQKDDVKTREKFYEIVLRKLSRYRPKKRIPKSNPPVSTRGDFLNAIFEYSFEKCNISICDNCKETIKDLKMIKQAMDGTKNKEMVTDPETKVRYQKYGHLSDLLDYIACYVFKKEFAIFTNAGKEKIRITGKRNSVTAGKKF